MILNINLIIQHFGEKEDILVIVLFLSSFFLINSLIRNKKLRLAISLITGIFIILQLTSLYFNHSFIGYQFFVHFNLSGIQGVSGLFTSQIIAAIVLLIVIIAAFYMSHVYFYEKLISFFNKEINSQIIKLTILIMVVLFLGTITTTGSFISDTKSLFSIVHTNSAAFEDILAKNGMSDYISPEKIKCKKGKNLIIISLESIERAFMGAEFANLTPNLQKLKKNWSYYDLEQNNGSGWTSGSLYTYLTGFPAYFGIHSNSIFQAAYHSEITSISHILKKADYNTTYINGNTDHSGVKQMLNTFHFDKIVDYKSVKSNGFESTYGLRDKDLFELAKKEIENQSSLNQPFALFLSTMDTHFPNGIYDDRMESFVMNKNSDLEFMVAAVDYMVGDFISFLNKKNMLENTIIYIFPDHLMMGDNSMFKNTGDRGLYLITNANKEKTAIDTSQILYQIDLPKIILNGTEIEHNLKFLTDYISGDKNTYIKNNIPVITEINTNGLLRIGSKPITLNEISLNYSNYKKDTMRYIAHAGGKIDGILLTNSKEALDLSYKKGFRLFELDIIQTKDGRFVAAHDWETWSRITNFKGSVPVYNEQFLKRKIHGKYTPLDMDGINEWFSIHKDAILITDKINDPITFSKKFIDPNRLMMELFDMNAVKQGIKAKIKSAMPSQSVIQNMTKEQIKGLKEMGVQNITVSRNFISGNIDLLNEFMSNNIRPYAYQLNALLGYDEEYVTKYEMDYIYGVYANDWDFE